MLTNPQVSRIFKVFWNASSANIKLGKNQLSKTVQLGGFVIPDALGLIGSFPPVKIINSIANLYKKELNSNLLVDTGLNIIWKKIKKGLSGPILTSN